MQFVGINVIGGFLTEINVTLPTGIRAVKSFGGPDIAALIWDKIGGRSTNNFRPAPARPCRFPAPTAFAPSE